MTSEEIKEILENHRKWLNNEDGGKRANLIGADLRNANLTGADLRGAYLEGADLTSADLRNADLRGAYLEGADLRNANLRGADLRGAYLEGADLTGADLGGADLRGADLTGADLGGADLRNADLSDVKYNENTAFFAMSCPEEGEFIGFKKAQGKIVKLKIPANAKRSSATSRKCRCSEAKVLSITNLDGTPYEKDSILSDKDSNFIYKVGETVKVKDFDEDRWNECSTGIHFFITRDEAVRY